METHGRITIYANYTEEELLSGTKKQQEDKVLAILVNSISLHDTNNLQTIYLRNYLYGDQDIKYKEKRLEPI